MTRQIKYYEATRPDGMHHQSMYPKLFRVRYSRMMSGRLVAVDRIVSAYDERHAHMRITLGDPHGDIRGSMEVVHLMDLEPVFEDPKPQRKARS